MTMRRKANPGRPARLLLASIAVSFVLAGCAPPVGDEDPNKRFAVEVEKAVFTLSVRFTDVGGTIRAENENVFRKYLQEYLRRGRSALVASTSTGTTPDAERSLKERLRSEGLLVGQIDIRTGTLPADKEQVAVLSFRGYMVKVPECGNWKGETGFNPTNLPHTNYGCSYKRNIGLMVADPGDFVEAAGIIELDAIRSDNIIRVFREGKAAGSDPPKGERGKFASPGQEQ